MDREPSHHGRAQSHGGATRGNGSDQEVVRCASALRMGIGSRRISFVSDTAGKTVYELRTNGSRSIDFAGKRRSGPNERLEVLVNPNHRRPDDPEAL
jgi:hypothetical protein